MHRHHVMPRPELSRTPDGFNRRAPRVWPAENTMKWNARRVLITGGTSFIGSHLTDALVAEGAQVRILDDLSSGRLENIQEHLESNRVEFIRADLLAPGVAQRAVKG